MKKFYQKEENINIQLKKTNKYEKKNESPIFFLIYQPIFD